ncbi:hypothetical protein KAR91_80220 [Candidatus Pacearchaeota archaeon]|nr:hypothetical protein [Candidatus Pacearchaeota archaeon]
MKVITIFQENASPLCLTDNDTSDLSEYTNEISRLLEISNVTILETSSGNAIIRPHKVTGIEVKNTDVFDVLDVPVPAGPTVDENQSPEEKVDDVIEETEDFITDGD